MSPARWFARFLRRISPWHRRRARIEQASRALAHAIAMKVLREEIANRDLMTPAQIAESREQLLTFLQLVCPYAGDPEETP